MARRRPRHRLDVIAVLIASLLATLGGRLYYLQVLDDAKPAQTAGLLHQGRIVEPAPRGLVLDARGVPLIANRSTRVVTVARDTLVKLPDKGTAVLRELAGVLGTTAPVLNRRITPCSPTVAAPCWTGQPYQPVPVMSDAPTAVVLSLSEHRERFPGVAVETRTVRSYPGGTLAAHVLGYAGAVDAADISANPKLADVDTIGRTGLEAQYDSVLRGTDGAQVVRLDARGLVAGDDPDVPVRQGDSVVTSLDSRVQALAEKALSDQVAAQRLKGRPATSGAVVVMDPNTGRVIAVASYPTYDPQLFVGGISDADYAALTAPGTHDPLVGRAIAGAYAPGSTFKLITSSSIVSHGEATLDDRYPCPGSLAVDGRVKTNFESESFASLNLRQALQVSCDTFFYAFAANEFYADQSRIAAKQQPSEYLQHMAASFGVASAPGIDLPAGEQASGSYADRETRMSRWLRNKAGYCADARKGFAGQPNAEFLQKLAAENCSDGWRYRAGDNADMAIGQGETTVSPLQLAVAYSAMLNGGTIWKPTLGWAVVNPSGTVVKTIEPAVKGKLPVSRATLNFIADSLHFTPDHTVSGALAFDGAPYKTELGGKTGTAEVLGVKDTSWLASWGPVSSDAAGNPHAKYVVVGMMEQTGTGASAAAPMLRQVYDGLLAPDGPSIPTALPKITASSVTASPTHPPAPGGPRHVDPLPAVTSPADRIR